MVKREELLISTGLDLLLRSRADLSAIKATIQTGWDEISCTNLAASFAVR